MVLGFFERDGGREKMSSSYTIASLRRSVLELGTTSQILQLDPLQLSFYSSQH